MGEATESFSLLVYLFISEAPDADRSSTMSHFRRRQLITLTIIALATLSTFDHKRNDRHFT